MANLTYETLVIVNDGDPVTFHEFLTDNEFDVAEENAIGIALDRYGVYHHGGGAIAEWSVRLAGGQS